jgi:hypothetical protein
MRRLWHTGGEAPAVGSMQYDAEVARRRGPVWDDTRVPVLDDGPRPPGTLTFPRTGGYIMFPRIGGYIPDSGTGSGAGAAGYVPPRACPDCGRRAWAAGGWHCEACGWAEAGETAGAAPGAGAPVVRPCCDTTDDGPHHPHCPGRAGDADHDHDTPAVLRDLRPAEVRARALDPRAWRPCMTAAEFADVFPGVPYEATGDLGPGLADLAGLVALDPAHAEEVLEMNAQTREYLAQRAAAFAELRGRLLAEWRAIGAS